MFGVEFFVRIVALPCLVVLLAYVFGSDGFETFIATCIGLMALMTLQIGRAVRLLFRNRHWLVTKLLTVGLLGFMWFIGFATTMLVITASGHDPRFTVPHVTWWVVAITAAAYSINNFFSQKSAKTLSRAMLFTLATLYALTILFIASLTFYANIHGTGGVVLVLAGQLQYVLLYVVVRLNYVERVVAYGQTRLRQSSSPFSLGSKDRREDLYMGLAVLPFFLPLLIIMAVFLYG